MKKFVIATFIMAFSIFGVNYVINTTPNARTQLSLENVEALACTLISENGPTGGMIWCVCEYDYLCHIYGGDEPVKIYGYCQER